MSAPVKDTPKERRTKTRLWQAVLAFLPGFRQLALVGGGEAGREALGHLEAELATVREVGFARDEEQFAVGLRCVAAPFFRVGGEPLGAISIGGPAARFTPEQAQAAVEPLLRVSEAISQELGHER